MAERSYYAILGVTPAATEDEIKAAYRALAWNREAVADQSELKLINEAYATLSSPGRREAYDQALAAGAVPVAAATAAAAPVPVSDPLDPAEDETPPGSFLIRLWGRVVGWALTMRRARARIIPGNYLIALMLVPAFGFLFGELATTTSEPVPTKYSLHDVVAGKAEHEYVSVIAYADYEAGYEARGKVDQNFYLLVMDKDVLVFSGPKGREKGEFVGRLRRMDSKLQNLVEEDANGSFFAGYTVGTEYYLDITYKPSSQALLATGMGAIILVWLLLAVSSLRRYTVFRALPESGGTGGEPAWPVLVEATGKFYPGTKRGLGRFDGLCPAQVVRDAESDGTFRVQTWYNDRLFQILIPARSHVELGLDHTGGTTRPALKVRAGGQTIYLRVKSMVEARRLAQAINQ